MAVVSTLELASEQTGTRGLGNNREYITVYHVTVDDQNDGPQVVIDEATLPTLGDSYTGVGNDVDPNAFCTELTPTRVEGKLLLWKVVAKWKTFDGPGGDANAQRRAALDKNLENPTEDPFDFHDEVEILDATFTVPVERAKYISGFSEAIETKREPNSLGPLHNSAFMSYDPPYEIDSSRSIISITKNLDAFPWTQHKQYRDAVNSDTFSITLPGGTVVQFQPYTVKLSPITGSFQLINGEVVWKTTYKLHVNDTETWRPLILDRGVHAKADTGDPNGRGGTIAADHLVAGVPRARRLRDAEGTPITEPVNLRDGKPVNPGSPPAYIRWAVYLNEKPFAPLGL